MIVRHKVSGVPKQHRRCALKAPVINAGDGFHEHPSQALLDLLTVQQAKKAGWMVSPSPIRGRHHCTRESRAPTSTAFTQDGGGGPSRRVRRTMIAGGDVETLGVKAYSSLREVLDGVPTW